MYTNVVTQRNYILNTNTYNCLINFRFPGRNTCGYPANICSVVAPTIFQNQYLCAHTHIETLHMYIYVATVTYVDILIFLSNKFESLSDSSKIWHGATAHINHIVKTPNAEIMFTKIRNPLHISRASLTFSEVRFRKETEIGLLHMPLSNS